jgi:hypothetical protein
MGVVGMISPAALRSRAREDKLSLDAEQMQPSFGDGQAIPEHAGGKRQAYGDRAIRSHRG